MNNNKRKINTNLSRIFLTKQFRLVLITSLIICIQNAIATGAIVSIYNMIQYIIYKDNAPNLLLLSQNATSWIGYVVCVLNTSRVVITKTRKQSTDYSPVLNSIQIFMSVTLIIHLAFIYFGQAHLFSTFSWNIKGVGMAVACIISIKLGLYLKTSKFSPFETLSNREKDVVKLIAKGYSNKSIADNLYITEPTVKTHIMHILEKTGYKNRTELAVNYQKSL